MFRSENVMKTCLLSLCSFNLSSYLQNKIIFTKSDHHNEIISNNEWFDKNINELLSVHKMIAVGVIGPVAFSIMKKNVQSCNCSENALNNISIYHRAKISKIRLHFFK